MADWNENSPAGTDLISLGDDAIRQLKVDIRQRMANEHTWTSAGPSTDGTHKAGFITKASGYIGNAAVENSKLESATPTPGASKIPISGADSKLARGWLPFLGALVCQNGTPGDQLTDVSTTVYWSTANNCINEYDTSSIHSLTTNTERLVVPAGVSYVRLTIAAAFNFYSGATNFGLQVFKGGLGFYKYMPNFTLQTGQVVESSAVVPVVANDYFYVSAYPDTGYMKLKANSWFSMEIVG